MRLALPVFITVILTATTGYPSPPVCYDDAPLRAVRFVDANEGWAVGDHGCVWHTIDGGKTWERQPTGTQASLRSVQFLTPYTGFAAGRIELPNGAGSQGVLLGTTDGGATWRELSRSLPGLNAVQFFDEKRGIVAGDGNAAFPSGVYRTEDGGRTWKMLPGPGLGISWIGLRFSDPDTGRVLCREGAFEVVGGKMTDPVNEKSPPAGTGKPGWPLPLHGEFKLDQQSGWAIGDLGAILGTTDGGKTWKTLKCGGQRAAVLFVHAQSTSVPLGAVAVLGRDGYFCAAYSATECDGSRFDAAVRMSWGATTSTALSPVLTHSTIIDGSIHPPERRQWVIETLVHCLRTWRPEVLVSDPLLPGAPSEDRELLLCLKEAFTLAADPKAFPEQIEKLGLAPHAVKKLYALAPTNGEADVTIDLTEFVPELGDAVKEFVEPAARVLGSGPVPDAVRFRLIAHRLPGAEKHTSLMQGIELAEGGTARRKRLEVSPVLQATNSHREKASRTYRRLDRVLASPADAGGIEPMLMKSLELIRGLPQDLAARTAVSVGQRLASAGHWTAAREVFALVAERYPLYPESVEAFRWLVRYHASGEVRRRIELGQMPIFQKAAFTDLTADVRQAAHTDSLSPVPKYRFSSPEVFQKWNQYALDLEPGLTSFGINYRLEPGTVFSLLAARRNLVSNGRVEGKLLPLLPDVGSDAGDLWRNRLVDEEEIAAGREPKHLKSAVCSMATVKPLLDGKLDDKCWHVRPEKMGQDPLLCSFSNMLSGRLPDRTETRFAFDDQFLYVAVTCHHPEGKQVPKAAKRARDEDLTGHDRVEILLDLDRDYQTYYRLCVDQRGCVAEDCWGDKTWNPRWFVAVDSTPSAWTAEIAIPLAELTGSIPRLGTTWAMNVVRVIPGVGTGSWGGPTGAAPNPESMGLLRFTKE